MSPELTALTAPLAIIALLALIAFLGWWLLIETEGAYLGQRVVIWLYDRYASRYDRIKQFDEQADFLLLAMPIMARLDPHDAPLMLDVATGTGRLPLLMASHADFNGRVIGLDLSRRMLDAAAQKAADQHFGDFITLMQHSAQPLPFRDGCFDAVTCLEALEFLPDPPAALAEMVRVLRPGGLLLTTRRISTPWLPKRTCSEAQMRRQLADLGITAIEFELWQADYSKVWAVKAGSSEPLGVRPLESLLQPHNLPLNIHRKSAKIPIIETARPL